MKLDLPQRPIVVPATPPLAARWPVLPGLAVALLTCGLLFFRTDNYPLRHMLLVLTLWGLAAGLLFFQVLRHPQTARRWREAITHPSFYCPLALALWAALRWSTMLVPYAGRPWVIDLLWLGVATLLGSLLSVLDQERPAGMRSLFGWARRFMALAAIGLGLQGCLQYGLGYLRHTLPATPPAGPISLPLLTPGPLNELLGPALAWRPPLDAGRPALLAAFTFISLSLFTRATSRRWRWIGAAGALLAAGSTLLQGQGRETLGLGIALIFAVGAVMARQRGRTRYLQGVFMLSTFLVVALNPDLSQGRNSALFGLLRAWWDSPLTGVGPGLPRLLRGAIALTPVAPGGLAPRVLIELGALGVIPFAAWFMALIAPRKSRWSSRGENRFYAQLLEREELWILLTTIMLFYLLVLHGGGPALLFLLGLLSGAWAGLRAADPAGALAHPAGEPARPAVNAAHRAASLRLLVGTVIVLVAGLALGVTFRHDVAGRYQQKGLRALSNGHWDTAGDAFAHAAHWAPDDPGHALGQAAAISQTPQATVAWPLLVQAGDIDPYSAGIQAAQTRWLADHGRSAEATIRIGQALDRSPQSVEYRLFRAELELKKLHTPAAARTDLNELAQRQVTPTPEQRALYTELANDLARQLLQP